MIIVLFFALECDRKRGIFSTVNPYPAKILIDKEF